MFDLSIFAQILFVFGFAVGCKAVDVCAKRSCAQNQRSRHHRFCSVCARDARNGRSRPQHNGTHPFRTAQSISNLRFRIIRRSRFFQRIFDLAHHFQGVVGIFFKFGQIGFARISRRLFRRAVRRRRTAHRRNGAA